MSKRSETAQRLHDAIELTQVSVHGALETALTPEHTFVASTQADSHMMRAQWYARELLGALHAFIGEYMTAGKGGTE